jgi:hypothetical protein
MTLPGTTIEEEFRRRNTAIDVVAPTALDVGAPPATSTGGGGACPTAWEAVYAKGESDAGEGDQSRAGNRRGQAASVK